MEAEKNLIEEIGALTTAVRSLTHSIGSLDTSLGTINTQNEKLIQLLTTLTQQKED